MSRPTIQEWGLGLAEMVSTRSTCMRLQVGCVLLGIDGRILSTGYNGAAKGQPHCTHESCETQETCEAVHAEQNALLQCRDVREIHACYVTHAPCFACTKLLLNTGCSSIFFSVEHSANNRAELLWEKAGLIWGYKL